MKLFALLLAMPIGLTAQNNTEVNLKDVSYGSSPQQKMDIFLPAKRSGRSRTFVMIHGGAWMSGDKSDMQPMIDSLKERFPGDAFLNINYRLARNGVSNVFPSQENDVRTAIAQYLAKAGEYGVSEKLVLFGVSAGGHLSLLHAYKNDPQKNVVAVIDGFGPTDLVTAARSGSGMSYALSLVTGATMRSNPKIYEESSPLYYVTKDVPPTIVLHGGQDRLVDASQSRSLVSKLGEKGVRNELVFYPSEAHGWGGISLTDSYDRIEAFLRGIPDTTF
jgi:acetyl esterase/lipase